jgi:hypothetical protein
MDVKIAVITGAAFAGVLVAGALAAPRGGGDDPQDGAAGPTSIINTGADGNFVLEPSAIRRDDDDDDHEDDDHERDHDDDDDDHEDDD